MWLPGLRLKVRHLMGLVAMTAVGLGLDSVPGGRACGAFPLRVELDVPPGHTIVAVAAGAEGSVERAESFLKAPGGLDVDAVPWAAGQPFEVEVPCGSRISLLSGRRLSPWQYHALVLRLDYADGTSQWLVREIP